MKLYEVIVDMHVNLRIDSVKFIGLSKSWLFDAL